MSLSTEFVGFSDALVILGAAGLVIPIFAQFRVTPVIGFILVGILVGPHGLGSMVDQYPWLYHFTISSPHAMEPYAELGIILLLFTIGLELSFKRLWALRGAVFGLGAAELLISALLIGVALLAIGETPAGSAGLGLALALSSTALVLTMSGTTSPVGRNAFAMLLFEDVALVPIIFLLGALAPHSADLGWSALMSTIGLGMLVVVAMLVIGRRAIPLLFARAARTKSPELFLSCSLLVVIVASLATTAVGLSPIVGALLAGLLIAETDYHSEVEIMTAPIKGLALGVFLITVGMSIDIRFISENWMQLTAAVGGVVLIKSLVTGLLLRISGARRAVAAETGMIMASPSETTLIVMATAVTAGLVSREAANFWQVVTAIGLTITPLLAKAGHVLARQIDMRTEAGADPLETEQVQGRTIIIGFGRVGRMVSDMLQEHEQAYIAVDADVDVVADARKEGYPVTFGDVSRPEMLERLHIDAAKALVLTMNDPVLSVNITKRVRAEYPDLTIIARARDGSHAAGLYKAGVTDAVPETLESSLQLSEAVLTDLGVAMGPVIASIHEKRDELRYEIQAEAGLTEPPRLKKPVRMPSKT